MTLNVDHLSFSYGRKAVLKDVCLPPVRASEITAVIGPNAAGKSTLLHCIAGFRRSTGQVRVDADGRPGRVLYLPQDLPPRSSITVFSAVLMARRLAGGAGRAADDQAVAATLTSIAIDELATRRLSELSGGQLQMVALAQAVIRQPDVLLLDEPTSSLDLRNQLQVLRLVREIATSQPAAVLAIIHDLALAARISDQIVVLHDGGVYASGPPHEVITPTMLDHVYGVDATVHINEHGVISIAVLDSL